MKIKYKERYGKLPVIRVALWSNGDWKQRIYGTVIGISDGIVGVIQDNGEYRDVPERLLRVLSVQEDINGKY